MTESTFIYVELFLWWILIVLRDWVAAVPHWKTICHDKNCRIISVLGLISLRNLLREIQSLVFKLGAESPLLPGRAVTLICRANPNGSNCLLFKKLVTSLCLVRQHLNASSTLSNCRGFFCEANLENQREPGEGWRWGDARFVQRNSQANITGNELSGVWFYDWSDQLTRWLEGARERPRKPRPRGHVRSFDSVLIVMSLNRAEVWIRGKHGTLCQCWLKVGLASATLAQL